jgi:hypothetical protein
MPVTTYQNQTSNTSGTSQNKTQGDKYSKEMQGLAYAAGGYNPKRAKAQAKYDTGMAKLQAQLDAGKLDQAKYDLKAGKLQSKLDNKLLKVAPGEAALKQIKPMEFYPDQTYVDLDPNTLASIQQRAQLAQNSQLPGMMTGYVGDVLGGKYLGDSNPYLKQMYDSAAGGVTSNYLNTVLPALEGRFAKAGGGGGAFQAMYNAAQQGLANELAGMGANMYGTAYMQERDLMNQAAGLAPTAQQMGYYAADELERAGRAMEGFERVKLQDAMDRFLFNQNAGFNEINRMTGALTQVPWAAGSGETQYDQRTIGSGSQQAPSPPDQMPMWAQMLGSIL